MTRRQLLAAVAATACTLALPAIGWAQAFPSRPITIVVPFAPGGGPDIVARKIAVKLAASLGTSVVVENRDGAGGRIGTASAARAPADGHTLLLGTSSGLALAPALYKDLPYDPEKAFAPIGLIVHGPLVLSVRSALPVTDIRSLLDYARQNPGKLNYGSAGVGSVHHVSGEMLRRALAIEMTHIPYKGGAPAWAAMSSGEVDLVIDAMFGGASQTLASGKARAIAITGDERLAALPSVRTFKEQGVQGMEVSFWWGMLAPRQTPAPVVSKINAALTSAVADPELKASFAALGLDLKSSTPEAFAKLISSEGGYWRTAVDSAKVKLTAE
jgi:tripartite-type tricarboxylate transporter receptor subunit TctC